MDELFNILSSGARFNKNKRKKKIPIEDATSQIAIPIKPLPPRTETDDSGSSDSEDSSNNHPRSSRRKKRHTPQKLAQIHSEQISAFRNRLHIQISGGSGTSYPDPYPTFEDILIPSWWNRHSQISNDKQQQQLFPIIKSTILRNISTGKWIHPTPIQMQSLPVLLQRRDVLGCAPTGSGKSGAFILPALFLASAPASVFYDSPDAVDSGHVRTLLLAPSRELAAQLHREVERLGRNKPRGKYVLLTKANAKSTAESGTGKGKGIDVLVSTPLRLLDAVKTFAGGDRLLNGVRLVVLDEADRLLDAADGTPAVSDQQTFLSQMDSILAMIPGTAARALFSATLGDKVRHLSESILRSPLSITVTPKSAKHHIGGANSDIDQKLLFVGKEEGKLLAIRQLSESGKLHPPTLIFLESKDRATALHRELLYDNLRVDLIHAEKTKNQRDASIANFRSGASWVLITTDLCARGVDFKHVNMVINYDLPKDGVAYTHRIGRTGRAGRKGNCVTFFTERDQAEGDGLRKVVNVMKLSGCDVPDYLLTLKKRRADVRIKRYGIDTRLYDDKKKKRKKKEGDDSK